MFPVEISSAVIEDDIAGALSIGDDEVEEGARVGEDGRLAAAGAEGAAARGGRSQRPR